MILCHIVCVCPLFHCNWKWLQEPLSLVYISLSFSCFLMPSVIALSPSPPPFFISVFPSRFFLNFSPIWLTLLPRLLSLCLPLLSPARPSPPSQPISASYEVWKMIVCRMKWTEFAGVMAWQNESRPSSPSITAPRRPRLRSVKVLAYWLLVVTTKCLIQCLWRGGVERRRWGRWGRWSVVGGMQAAVALSKILFW